MYQALSFAAPNIASQHIRTLLLWPSATMSIRAGSLCTAFPGFLLEPLGWLQGGLRVASVNDKTLSSQTYRPNIHAH